MSMGAKVGQLESKQQSLDHAVRDLMKVVGATHEVVSMVLMEQMELRKEHMELRKEFVEFKAQEDARFKEQANHNNRVEDILIQIIHRLPDPPAIYG